MISCLECVHCECFKLPSEAEDLRRSELARKGTILDLCHSNIGWYTDRSIGDEHLIDQWIADDVFGVYMLWHKDDYCEQHEQFHMRALYVGKGKIGRRLLSHWKRKDFSEEMLVYWTFLELPNRLAKYYEQLMLDVYKPPLNIAELTGKITLCAHFPQFEVD